MFLEVAFPTAGMFSAIHQVKVRQENRAAGINGMNDDAKVGLLSGAKKTGLNLELSHP